MKSGLEEIGMESSNHRRLLAATLGLAVLAILVWPNLEISPHALAPQPSLVQTHAPMAEIHQHSGQAGMRTFSAATPIRQVGSKLVAVGSTPDDMVLDPATDNLYVANYGSNNVSVISGATGKVIDSVDVGTYPQAITYDPNASCIAVANIGSASVSIISDQSNVVTRTISVAPYPGALGYDPYSGDLYVLTQSWPNATIAVVNPANSTPVRTFLFHDAAPGAVVAATSTGDMYVANDYTNNVTVFSGSTNLPIGNIGLGGRTPNSMMYDPSSGLIYLELSSIPDQLVAINTTTEEIVHTVTVGSFPYGMAVDPATKELFVVNTDSNNVSVIDTSTWGPASSVPAGSRPTAILADLTNDYLYLANAGSANVSVISLDSLHQVANVTIGHGALEAVEDLRDTSLFIEDQSSNAVSEFGLFHPIVFNETGLPSGTGWAVRLDGLTSNSSTQQVTFPQENGIFSYSVVDVPGRHESGLPYSGNVTVSNRSVYEPLANFTIFEWSIEFQEHGLPSGYAWQVLLNGLPANSTNSSLTSALPNGTTLYLITGIPGYHESEVNYSGVIPVAGGPIVEPLLDFTLVTYSVQFTELGLPGGTTWGESAKNWINGTEYNASSTSAYLRFNLPNGSYSFSTEPPAGFSISPQSRNVTVTGESANFTANFVQTPGAASLVNLGSGSILLVVVVATGALVVVGAILVLRGRRGKPPME
jgi:YVTN family beta-propeller protein